MPKLNLDFTGLTPATGGFGSDHIPRGEYNFIVTDYSDRPNNKGGAQHAISLTVADGDYAGCRVVDRFQMDSDKPFHRQRLMAFLLCIGLPIDAQRVTIDSQTLLNRTGRMSVKDNEIPATGDFAARMSSQVGSYKSADGKDAATILSDNRARRKAAASPAKATPSPENVPDAIQAVPESNGSVNTEAAEDIPAAVAGIDELFP